MGEGFIPRIKKFIREMGPQFALLVSRSIMVEQSYSDLTENLFQDTSIKEQLYDTDTTISSQKLLEAAQSTILTQCESNGLGASSSHLQGAGFGTLACNKLVDSKGNAAKRYSPEEVISIVSGAHELVHVLI